MAGGGRGGVEAERRSVIYEGRKVPEEIFHDLKHTLAQLKLEHARGVCGAKVNPVLLRHSVLDNQRDDIRVQTWNGAVDENSAFNPLAPVGHSIPAAAQLAAAPCPALKAIPLHDCHAGRSHEIVTIDT